MNGTFALALRTTLRDWRAGELRLVAAALLVAVAAIASVGFFADRMNRGLETEATQLLGADAVLRSSRPIAPELEARASELGLRMAQTLTFPSMVAAPVGETLPQLAAVKAVSEGYPLRGAVRIAERADDAGVPADRIPSPGSVWVDPQLLLALGLSLGDRVELGERSFVAERLITLEPDRGANFINFAPRVMLRLDELPGTGLIQPASRVTHRLLVAGAPEGLRSFGDAVEGAGPGLRFETLEGGRPELRATLERAEKFLALVALLAALIAATAIALGARRFADRHLDGYAVMRALGITTPRLLALVTTELLVVSIVGGLVGVLLGLGVQAVLVTLVSSLIRVELPAPSLVPAGQAFAAGVVLLLGFALPTLIRLATVPPLRVLRRDLGAASAPGWIVLSVAVAVFAALLYVFARDARLATTALGGFFGLALVFALVAWALVRALTGLVRRAPLVGARGSLLRVAVASWARRQGASVAQTAALAIALMALILLTVTRNDLLESWREASPADAPNRFVINVLPDQRDGVAEALTGIGVREIELYPMIRGRLVAVNGAPLRADDLPDPSAQRMLNRELNLSYAVTLPAHNRIERGRWLQPQANEVTVESGIFDRLGLALGDRLTFDIAGEQVEVQAVGVRKLDWGSMKVNFFMILSPAALQSMPQTFVTSFHLPAEQASATGELVRRYPNLTVLDTGNILRQVQLILDQVTRAIEFLFYFTLAAGLLVLYASQANSQDDRTREAAILRALGASRQQLSATQLIELALAGGLAGLMAGGGALAIGAVLAQVVFEFSYSPSWSAIPLGVGLGALSAVAAGWFGLRGTVNAPPLQTLRRV